MSLAVIESHPVQYHAPVYRALGRLGVPTTVIYGSDLSVAGYRDREFGASFAWDGDLLGGQDVRFLSRVAAGGPRAPEAVRAAGLAVALREVAPAAVLLLGYSSRFDRAALLAARRSGARLLFRGETTDHAVARGPLKALLRDGLLRALYASCAALLYIGRRSREHYERLGVPPSRLVFAPYCVDTTPFTPGEAERAALRRRARAQLGIADDALVLLFAGKLAPRKEPGLLLEAARLLPPGLRERACVLFLGDGELRAELARRAQAPPAVPAAFAGFRNQRELSPIYHAADALVLPSAAGETWGLVVNEALHHGLPCAVSDRVGCAPDLVDPGVTGERFAAGSAQGCAAAAARALGLAELPATRERCRERAAGYSVERAAAGVAAAYSLATGAPAPAGDLR